jgi:hypothetical protein
VRQFLRLVRRVGTSWRFVTSLGALVTAAGAALWISSQVTISLAQSSTTGYGAVGAASTTPPAGAVAAATAPITGAGLFWPGVVLLVGLICVGVGFYLRRTVAQSTD